MLMLRKMCQPYLDAAGFPQMHVGMGGTKNLVLMGQCGQVIVTIYGISFSNKTINKAEREFATELFVKFLYNNQKALREFAMISKEFKQNTHPLINDYVKHGNDYGNSVNFTKLKLQVSLKGVMVQDYLSEKGYMTLLHKHADSIAAAREYLKDKEGFAKQQKVMQEARAKLSKCDI